MGTPVLRYIDIITRVEQNIGDYPNPAEGQLTVEAVDQSDGKLLDNGTTVDFETFIFVMVKIKL